MHVSTVELLKVKWPHFTGEVNNLQISSGSCVPKINMGLFLTELFKKIKGAVFVTQSSQLCRTH